MKSNNNIIIFSVVIAILLIGGVIWLGQSGKTNSAQDTPVNNVYMEGENQIVEIRAKGGYSPMRSTAKAGIPTILRMDAEGTFDCSAFVRIPKLDISESLTMAGSTDIPLGVQGPGVLSGGCSMGMYPFEIVFEG